jgi:hypothetical protein
MRRSSEGVGVVRSFFGGEACFCRPAVEAGGAAVFTAGADGVTTTTERPVVGCVAPSSAGAGVVVLVLTA